MFRVQKEDLEAIANLVNSAYRGESSRAGWTTEADLVAGQRTDAESLNQEMQAHPEQVLFGFRELGVLRACVKLEFSQKTPGSKTCYLGMLTVDPTLQNRGFGRKILEESEKYALARGADSMRMHVIPLRDSLLAWYERRGYRRTGATQAFPYGNEKAGLPLREDLNFVVLEKKLGA